MQAGRRNISASRQDVIAAAPAGELSLVCIPIDIRVYCSRGALDAR
jgi:hypothetical protein